MGSLILSVHCLFHAVLYNYFERGERGYAIATLTVRNIKLCLCTLSTPHISLPLLLDYMKCLLLHQKSRQENVRALDVTSVPRTVRQ